MATNNDTQTLIAWLLALIGWTFGLALLFYSWPVITIKAQTVLLMLAGGSALGALGAAIGALLSARATRKATEAQLVLRFLEDYSAPEMLQALRVLRNWEDKYGVNFEKEWIKRRKANEAGARKVDEARRKVRGYFFNALRLCDSGYVSKRFLLEVVSVDGINILYDIVEPLERVLNPKYDKSRFQKLRQIVGRVRTGKLLTALPHN